MKKRGLYFYLFFALPVLIVSSGCSKEGKQVAAKGASEQTINVKVTAVEARSVQRTVEAIGTLYAWDEVTVGSEIPGTVARINADLGDKVAAGDLIALFDQREARLNLEDAQAALDTNTKTVEKERARLSDAKTTIDRYDELFKQGMVSASQHDTAKMQYDVAAAQLKEAEARLDQAKARLDLSKKRLSDTEIRAPISGHISKRFISTGESVKEKVPLFTIVSTENLKFRGTVPEVYVPELKVGQETAVSVEAFPEKSFKGKLTRLSPAVAPDTRTLEVEAVIPNPRGVLKPGFFAKGTVLTKKEEGVPFVPEPAIYSFVGVSKVFVINGGAAHERLIKTGVREGDFFEAIGDVKPGEMVATTNLSSLYAGAKVNIISK